MKTSWEAQPESRGYRGPQIYGSTDAGILADGSHLNRRNDPLYCGGGDVKQAGVTNQLREK
jgi:hypothetical protein